MTVTRVICAGRRGEVVARDQVGQPVRLAELQAVPVGQRQDLGGLAAGRPAARSASSRKKCSNPAGLITSIIRAGDGPGVPHGVQLAARLGDVAAGAEHDLAVAGPEPDLALGDDRVLVLPGVQVRRHERADRERVLHD